MAARVLSFCHAFHWRYDHLPSQGQICRHFGWKNLSRADRVLRSLCKNGHLEHIHLPHSKPFYRFPR